MAGMPPQMPVEAAGLARCFLAQYGKGMERAQGLLRRVWGLKNPMVQSRVYTGLFREQGAGNFDATWDRLGISIKHEG